MRRTFSGAQSTMVLASIIVSYIAGFVLSALAMYFFNRFAMFKMKLLYTQAGGVLTTCTRPTLCSRRIASVLLYEAVHSP